MAAKKPTKKGVPTGEALREAMLSYLDKYDASEAQLRRVLLRRIPREATEDERERAAREIDELVARSVDAKLVDDRRFAENLVRSGRDRGSSTLKLRQKLSSRGVGAPAIDAAIETVGSQSGQGDREAALAYVRRRRLRERYDLTDRAERQKALAALARQGFSFAVAAAALDVDPNDDASED